MPSQCLLVLLGTALFSPCTVPEKCLSLSVEWKKWMNLGSLSQTKEHTFSPHKTIRGQVSADLYMLLTLATENRVVWPEEVRKVSTGQLGIKGEKWEE